MLKYMDGNPAVPRARLVTRKLWQGYAGTDDEHDKGRELSYGLCGPDSARSNLRGHRHRSQKAALTCADKQVRLFARPFPQFFQDAVP